MPSGPATRALYVLAICGGNGWGITTRVSSSGSSVVEPRLGAGEHGAEVFLERVVVADALVHHLVDRAVLAVVGDVHLHPVLPLVVPDRRRAGHHHERRIDHVDDVEQREGDRQHALALEVVDVVDVHRLDGLLVQRVHRLHPPLQRVETESASRPHLPLISVFASDSLILAVNAPA